MPGCEAADRTKTQDSEHLHQHRCAPAIGEEHLRRRPLEALDGLDLGEALARIGFEGGINGLRVVPGAKHRNQVVGEHYDVAQRNVDAVILLILVSCFRLVD